MYTCYNTCTEYTGWTTLVTASYNKTNDFNFYVQRYTEVSSDVPYAIGFNTFDGELVRFARLNSDVVGLFRDVRELIHRFITKGFNGNDLFDRYRRLVIKKRSLFLRFNFHDHSMALRFWDNCIG